MQAAFFDQLPIGRRSTAAPGRRDSFIARHSARAILTRMRPQFGRKSKAISHAHSPLNGIQPPTWTLCGLRDDELEKGYHAVRISPKFECAGLWIEAVKENAARS
jgi:hypothetical protein